MGISIIRKKKKKSGGGGGEGRGNEWSGWGYKLFGVRSGMINTVRGFLKND